MEIFQATKGMMVHSFKRFITSFFVVIFIALPIFLIVNFMYSNSSFSLFEGLTKDKVLLVGESEYANNTTNVTTNIGGRIHNKSDDNIKGSYNNIVNNNTMSKVQGKIENDTTTTEGRSATTIGLKNESITSSTNDSNLHKVQGKIENGTTTTEGRSATTIGLKNESTMHAVIHDDYKEKFLDGLLASEFDETSCISRLQSHLYRKSSPHKPSSYLISKLRNYEEIHRRCGPNSKAYNKIMTKILHSKNIKVDDASMCKYLIWTPANGLGNQMVSITATFLYALLTNRTMLVRFRKDKQGLFCEPFRNSTWLLSEKSPFWNQDHVETYQSVIEKEKDNKNSKVDLPSSLFLNLQYQANFHEKFFHCDDSQALLIKVPLLILQSDQYFVPSLFMTPFFNKEVEAMFDEKDTVFHHLGRYLFHPSNSAWRLITNFYEAHLAKADEKIGLQIRVFNPISTPQEVIMNLVLNCTIHNKLLPKVIDMKNSMSTSSDKNKTITKAVLVASLYPEYGENLKTMYMNKPTDTGEVIEVYQPSGEEQQKFNDNKHNMKAWVDMYLLSLSDVLVTTSLSTFGYVAQGLGNLKPWLLYKLTNNETHFPACVREFSMEPCYHAPPKHYCSGKPIKDFASSFIYTRECKDYWPGVKLVN
ncbi:probable fucosyltransferase 8 isoform X1 [Trifolium pratense]|uniref:probable fucosyltransferase 8 isoform X1 n=1 Tax=Trifolium pratense TaxID=57577 RepID=UPI001E690145|nr:probable fucosyltransferase 8 isoform X1 [Trifolium pratense]